MQRKERITQLLGMSHGAAASRLRKMVLFRQLQKYGDDVCVRCGLKIEDIEDLSIEHIEPWEGRSAELFWDLNNIAFSHMRCNRQHVFKGGNHRKIICPEGKAWCRTHKLFLPVESFSKHSQVWNGIRRDCRECEKKYKDFHRYGIEGSEQRCSTGLENQTVRKDDGSIPLPSSTEDSEQGAQPVSNTGPS